MYSCHLLSSQSMTSSRLDSRVIRVCHYEQNTRHVFLDLCGHKEKSILVCYWLNQYWKRALSLEYCSWMLLKEQTSKSHPQELPADLGSPAYRSPLDYLDSCSPFWQVIRLMMMQAALKHNNCFRDTLCLSISLVFASSTSLLFLFYSSSARFPHS